MQLITQRPGSKGRRRRDRRARHAVRPELLLAECLEGRLLLSDFPTDIRWLNRGHGDHFTDNFEVYDKLPRVRPDITNAELARQIVDQAILDWEAVIQDFHYRNPGGGGIFAPLPNTFFLYVSA